MAGRRHSLASRCRTSRISGQSGSRPERLDALRRTNAAPGCSVGTWRDRRAGSGARHANAASAVSRDGGKRRRCAGTVDAGDRELRGLFGLGPVARSARQEDGVLGTKALETAGTDAVGEAHVPAAPRRDAADSGIAVVPRVPRTASNQHVPFAPSMPFKVAQVTATPVPRPLRPRRRTVTPRAESSGGARCANK